MELLASFCPCTVSVPQALVPFSRVSLQCLLLDQLALAMSLILRELANVDIAIRVALEAFALPHFLLPLTFINAQNLVQWDLGAVFCRLPVLFQVDSYTQSFFLSGRMVNLADIKSSREVVRPFHAVMWNVYLLKPRQLGLLRALTYAFLYALTQALLKQVVGGFDAHLAQYCRIPTP